MEGSNGAVRVCSYPEVLLVLPSRYGHVVSHDRMRRNRNSAAIST